MSISLRDQVADELLSLTDPPVDVALVVDEGTWWSVVVARDGRVLWRFVCESNVWRLEAAATWEPGPSFDADLLARQFLGHGLTDSTSSAAELMRRSVRDLVEELQVIRRPVLDAFRPENWSAVRTSLLRAGRQRDLELFGRPLPPGVT